MSRFKVLFILGACFVGCLFFILRGYFSEAGTKRELEIYVAAGMQKPMEEIVQAYEDEYGVRVMLNFGGSGQLAARLELSGGDLYFPTDVSYIEKMREKQLITDSYPVSHLTAGLLVAKGNPRNIRKLSDLARDGMRVVIAERSAGIGECSHLALADAQLLDKVESGMISKVGTVNEVALQVDIGAADVGIVWDAISLQFKQSEFVRIADFEEDRARSLATIGILKSSARKAEALRFIKYLTARDIGSEVFSKHGFHVYQKQESK